MHFYFDESHLQQWQSLSFKLSEIHLKLFFNNIKNVKSDVESWL